ncbi:hypothetical protein CXB51_026385 [Gossypium anomalum]|uniref:3,4-dihydroxy-2-butanone-4-phosphate synthase n=1 Tax=Gossypium anomalum TaxID=47600 RepID=A0A8J5YHP6_9ROSI|nr:hypothetical protein CXB51_026385 [Gossypium anomalum]
MGLSFMGVGKVRAALVSGEWDVLSYPKSNGVVVGKTSFVDGLVDQQAGIEVQPNAISFETLAAEITPVTNGFFADEYDLDHPTQGFASIQEAIEDIRQGKLVIVVDDEDRENEGDLIMAASMATPEAMAFIVKHGTGIVCVSMKAEDLERLELPLMVTQKENEEKLCTAFTVSVDAEHGTTTGVSACDRATTVLTRASKDSKPEDSNRPGHIFPLKYREGGVLKRAGHTEASVDLAVLAGLEPVAVLCEIVDDDGSMARLPKLREFAQAEKLKIISIADLIRHTDRILFPKGTVTNSFIAGYGGTSSSSQLIFILPFVGYQSDPFGEVIYITIIDRYRRKRERLVELAAAPLIPTLSLLDGIEHIAMVKGEISDGQDILVRVHSECLTSDVFGSARCDCGNQLALAVKQIEASGRGFPSLARTVKLLNVVFDFLQILRDLGVHTMSLMTNNPAKPPLLNPITKDNKRYLETKQEKLGHIYGSNINSTCNTAYQEI